MNLILKDNPTNSVLLNIIFAFFNLKKSLPGEFLGKNSRDCVELRKKI